MLRMQVFLILMVLGTSCRPNANLPQNQYFSPKAKSLNLHFAGQAKEGLEYDQFGSLTKRTYQRHLSQLAAQTTDKLLFYAHTVDFPEKTPYTALGKLMPFLDTTQMKTQGFVNRRIQNQRYLHKRGEDRTRKIVTAEYVVKTDSGYFYLFSYAPIRHLLHNDEDIIIAQDSLNRKFSAVIGNLTSKNYNK